MNNNHSGRSMLAKACLVAAGIIALLLTGTSPAQATGIVDGTRRSSIPAEQASLVASTRPPCRDGVLCPAHTAHVNLTLTSTMRCGLKPYIRVKSISEGTAVVRLRASGVTSCDLNEMTTASKRLPSNVTRVVEAGTGRVLNNHVLRPR